MLEYPPDYVSLIHSLHYRQKYARKIFRGADKPCDKRIMLTIWNHRNALPKTLEKGDKEARSSPLRWTGRRRPKNGMKLAYMRVKGFDRE